MRRFINMVSYSGKNAPLRSRLGLVAICVLLAAMAAAQDATTYRGMVRLNRAPVSNEVLKVKLPRPVDRTLSNGLKLVILESNRTPTITVNISVPSAAPGSEHFGAVLAAAGSGGHAGGGGSHGRHDDDGDHDAHGAPDLRGAEIGRAHV